jgi:hypothetical protein
MGKKWTSEENKILSELYPTNATKTIAEKLDRTVQSLNSQAHILRLKKCPEYLKANVYIIEAITREEHQLRNSVHNLPEEIKEVINLKRTITKLITENGKRQNSRP